MCIRDLGCNPQSLPSDSSILAQVQVSDNCGVLSTNVSHVDATNGCGATRTFKIVATDNCLNKVTNTVAYTFTVDAIAPQITTAPSGSDLGCNPQSLPSDSSILAQVQVSDNCGVLSTNVSHVDATNGCGATRTFKIVATDNCLNKVTNTVAYTFTVDAIAPQITTAPSGSDLGCNPQSLPSDSSILAQVQVSDNCGVLSTNVTHLDPASYTHLRAHETGRN